MSFFKSLRIVDVIKPIPLEEIRKRAKIIVRLAGT